MKYKNPYYRKVKNAYPLEVSCGHCKTPIVIYAKAGKGNLIKMQLPRIADSEVNLENHAGHLVCFNCGEELARKGTYNGNLTYWVIRGKINTKNLNNYRL